jgi:Uma2 family endonuclease
VDLYEPELHLSAGDVLVPDFAGWRREAMPQLPQTPFFTAVPTWVLEVLSASTASIDRVRKSRIYAREGVQSLWFIDPVGKVVECNTLHQGQWLSTGTFGPDEKLRAAPFEAAEFEISEWFVADAPPKGVTLHGAF